ncbi:hypothetical protein [Alcaligenes faecalis]|nr:hypothetical protein [Alcaligenes faecalis]
MREIHVNAQLWDRFYSRSALMKLAEQKGRNPVSVPTFEHDGFLFLGCGTMFPGIQSKESKRIYAYRLIPESMYKGPVTTIYHDPEAIAAGTRDRGSMIGLVVIALTQRLVCVEKVEFLTHNDSVAAPADELEQISLF